MAQIVAGRGGKYVEIDDDVGNVASNLHAIDHHIRLRYSEAGEYFVVYWKPDEWDEGEGYMITSAQDLDQRIVKRVEEIYHRCQQPGYSFADDLDAQEKKAKAAEDHNRRENNGEIYERMAHAMRKDLGYDKAHAFVPKEITSA